jgi:hypothetical protein
MGCTSMPRFSPADAVKTLLYAAKRKLPLKRLVNGRDWGARTRIVIE